MNRIIWFILITPFTLSSVHALVCEGITEQSIPEQNPEQVRWLGGGYDSEREHIKIANCLNGNRVSESGSATGKIGISIHTDVSKVVQEINQHNSSKSSYQVGVNAGVSAPVNNYVSVGARIDFERGKNSEFIQNIAGTNSSYGYSQELTLVFDVRTGNGRFDIDGNDPLTKTALDALKGDACTFKLICGDSFIHQTVEGAKLLVTMRIGFKNKSEYEAYQKQNSQAVRNAFAASVGFKVNVPSTGINLGADVGIKFGNSSELVNELNRMNTSIRENGSLEFFAHQIGGDVAYLGRLFGNNFCKLSDVSSCMGSFDEVLKYIASDEFIKGVKEKPGVLSYIQGRYQEVYANYTPIGELTDEIQKSRMLLAQKFHERLHDIGVIELTLTSENLPADKRKNLGELRTTITKEAEQLRITGIGCFRNLANCKRRADSVLDELTPYNREELVLDMNEWLISVGESNVPGKLSGISTRCLVGTKAEDYMYAGFNISGGTKKVTVGAYTVTQIPGNNFLPRLEIKTFPEGKSVYVDNNQNLVHSVAHTLDLSEGWYTVTVSPISQTGIGIVYVNEVDESPTLLSSISTRCYVGTKAEDSMIAGVSVAGGNQCVEMLGLGISQIPGNSFLPMLNVRTFPDNVHFNAARSVYADVNTGHKARISKLQQLETGPYTSMVTPVSTAGIGQVAISTKTNCN